MCNFGLYFNNVFIEQVNAGGYESSLEVLAGKTNWVKRKKKRHRNMPTLSKDK